MADPSKIVNIGRSLFGFGKKALSKSDEAADAVRSALNIADEPFRYGANAVPSARAAVREIATGMGVAPTVAATAKSPGIFSRLNQGYRGLPKIARGGIKLAGYGIPAALAINYIRGRDSGADVAAPIPASVLEGFMTPQKSQADVLREILAGPQFGQSYADQAAAVNAQQQSDLDKYLGTYGQYSQNQAQTILDEFNKIAAESQALAAATRQRGQETASEIDRLYQDYADNAAAAYAGEGLATPASEVSGMVPVSGEAATQAQTVPTYGQSIADYLGREANIAGTGYEALGASQRAQGAGMSQGMRDRYQLLDAQMRYAAAQEAAQRLAGAQAQDTAFQRDLAVQLATAEAADQAAAVDRQRRGSIGWIQAGQVWEDAKDENARRDIEAALGIDRNSPQYKTKAARKQAIQDLVLQYPELLDVISLAAGA